MRSRCAQARCCVADRARDETPQNLPRKTGQPHEDQSRHARPPVRTGSILSHTSAFGTGCPRPRPQAQDRARIISKSFPSGSVIVWQSLRKCEVWQTDPKCQKSRRHAVLALHDSTLQLAVSEESHSLASPSSAAFDSPCTEYHPLSHESRFPFSKIRAEPSAGESLRTGRQCSC